ncbi:MAG: hypothetical protein M1818_007456 [Claussenomyces sp. TS43310]|nr:MAG: hypothetical protein M1818_007456 [Claussenomyces sp. TS43310]
MPANETPVLTDVYEASTFPTLSGDHRRKNLQLVTDLAFTIPLHHNNLILKRIRSLLLADITMTTSRQVPIYTNSLFMEPFSTEPDSDRLGRMSVALDNGAAIDDVNPTHGTLLHCCISGHATVDNTELINFLIKRKADPRIQNRQNQTPLDLVMAMLKPDPRLLPPWQHDFLDWAKGVFEEEMERWDGMMLPVA